MMGARDMKKVLLVAMSLWIENAAAKEIETDCPLASPFNGRELRGAFSSADTPEDPDGNILNEQGLHWHHTNLLEKWNDTSSIKF